MNTEEKDTKINGEPQKPTDELPDISGVFDIDEAAVPDRPVEKAAPKTISADEVFAAPENKKSSTTEKKAAEKAEKTERRLAGKQKLMKYTCIALLVLVFALVLGIVLTVYAGYRARPDVETQTLSKTTLSEYYTVNAKVMKESDTEAAVAVLIDENAVTAGVAEGQSVNAAAASGAVYTGTVRSISVERTSSTGLSAILSMLTGNYDSDSYTVIYIALNGAEELEAGTEVSLKISVRSVSDSIFVPSYAVQWYNSADGNTAYVWVYDESSKEIFCRTVTTGESISSHTAITASLKEGEKVVTSFDCNFSELHDGMKVIENNKTGGNS